MQPINKKTCVDALYELKFLGQHHVMLYARSDKEAIQRAVEYFRPSKRQKDQIEIVVISDELNKETS